MVLQRYEVIAPLLNRPLPRGVRDVILDELAGTLHYDADGRLITVGKRTIERHLASYLKLGLEGLKPQVRQEQGSLKAFPPLPLNPAQVTGLRLLALPDSVTWQV